MFNMKRIIKTNRLNDTNIIKRDIETIFNKLIKSPYQTYFITYGRFNKKTVKEVNFLLKNKLMNYIWKDNRSSFHIINYLFVIEYPEIITNPSLKYFENIDKIDYHAHLIINTTLPKLTLEYYIKTLLENNDVDFQNITKRKDMEKLSGYLTKQSEFLTTDSYEYKLITE